MTKIAMSGKALRQLRQLQHACAERDEICAWELRELIDWIFRASHRVQETRAARLARDSGQPEETVRAVLAAMGAGVDPGPDPDEMMDCDEEPPT